jgi:hypothetical protein
VYPVRFGFIEVRRRFDALLANGHYAEALRASVFAFEKTLKRTLRYCALNRGFGSKQCDKLFDRMGFQQMQNAWPVFERDHRTLAEFVGQNDWPHVPSAVTMRNKLVHGERVMNANEVMRGNAMQEFQFDPWQPIPGRKKSSLAWLGLKQTSILERKDFGPKDKDE